MNSPHLPNLKSKPSINTGVIDVLFAAHKKWASWLAKQFYYKYKHHCLEFEEFEQTAFEALLTCTQTFDGSKGINFRTFAEYRLRGAMLNLLPKINEQTASYKYREELQTVNEDSYTEKPIIGLISMIQSFAIDYILIEQEELEEEGYSSLTSPEYFTLVDNIKSLVKKLPTPKDIILSMYYFKGISFKTIAEDLNVTKGRISQLHSEAIKELTKLINKTSV